MIATNDVIIQAALQDNGIEAKLSGNEASALGFALDGPDAIEIIVKASDFDKAKSIIEELDASEPEDIPAWTCVCGEEVDAGFGICWSCGAEYPAARAGGTEE